jgi:hypothetical protein
MHYLGNDITSLQAGSCSPYITNADMKVATSWGKAALDPQAIASPCGSIGNSIFIKPTHFLMTLSSYLTTPKPFQLMRQGLRGKATREKDSNKALIVQMCNGSIHKMSTLLFG